MSGHAGMLARVRSEGGYFLLSDRTRFALTGADRVRYLNGQVTNDVRKLQPGAAMLACVVSAKGKLDGVVWIWSDGDALIVEAEAALAEALAIRLERYIVADDVTLTPLAVPPEFHATGALADRVRDAGLALREIARLGAAGVDFAAENLVAVRALGDAPEIDAATREVLRIERGVPAWGAELGPDTLPAEAGLDRTAVDFHKGCYIGQEVISRIESVGRTNRALHGFRVMAGEAPAPGDALTNPASPDAAVGAVTSISAHFELPEPIGLCYIKRSHSGDADVLTASGARLTLIPLPCE